MLSSQFIEGDVTSVSRLLPQVLGLPLAMLVFVIDLSFIARGNRQIGKLFALRSTSAIAGLSLCLAFVGFPMYCRRSIASGDRRQV